MQQWRGWVEAHFPNLRGLYGIDYWITSPVDGHYNCIAWAAGDKNNFWWPKGHHWPDDLIREETIPNFITAFNQFGYEITDNGDKEADYEKVALYAIDQDPTHMARQLLSGYWTSKLGSGVDIIHADVTGVENDIYGKVVQFLKRRAIAQSTI